MDCIDRTFEYLKNNISNMDLLEVGSCSENGRLKNGILKFKPKKYIGIDIGLGKCVDIACMAENILNIFKEESFDIIISLVVFEHIKNWKKAIINIKKVCKKNGIIYLVIPSSWEYHGSPKDYWRYGIDDIKQIFSDFNIELLEEEFINKDRRLIYFKGRKPENFKINDISKYEIKSIITGKKEICLI